MSLVIRYAADGTKSSIEGVYKHCIEFLVLERNTGKTLFNTLLKELEALVVAFENVHGQTSNTSGIQARLLQRNS